VAARVAPAGQLTDVGEASQDRVLAFVEVGE
jgi:hypothetical protein